MSFDAVTWAKAQPMPFKTAPARRRAKAVLAAFATYVDARGRGWAAVNILALETELEPRTVQRALAELKESGLIEETGDQEAFQGKLYPIYQLPLDRGPQNTRERIRLDREAVGAADELGAKLSPQRAKSVTPSQNLSPVGVTEMGAWGDTMVSPKQEDNPFGESNAEPSARAAAARLDELERIAPASILRFYDQPLALAALQALIADGVDVEALPAALRRMADHPDFRSRKHPPQLHDWLRKRGFLGWLADDQVDAGLPPADARTPFAIPEDLAEQLCAIDGVEGYLRNATWSDADRTLFAATTIARDRLVDRIGKRRLAELEITIQRIPAN